MSFTRKVRHNRVDKAADSVNTGYAFTWVKCGERVKSIRRKDWHPYTAPNAPVDKETLLEMAKRTA